MSFPHALFVSIIVVCVLDFVVGSVTAAVEHVRAVRHKRHVCERIAAMALDGEMHENRHVTPDFY